MTIPFQQGLPDYTTGTASVAAGSNVVNFTGATLTWADATSGQTLQACGVGDAFICGGMVYEIESVNSPTQITLEQAYVGATNAAIAYKIRRRSIPSSSAMAAALQDLLALGSDASPDHERTIDDSTARLKLYMANFLPKIGVAAYAGGALQGLKESLSFDPVTGKVSAPSGRVHALSGADIADFVPVVSATALYRIDRARAQSPRTAVTSAINGDTITLTTPDADLFFVNSYMLGASYVRIWNVTKTPNVPAWVKASADTSHLQVTNAADIGAWSDGDTIQIGDPTSVVPGRTITLDISPTLQSTLGVAFPTKALLLKGTVQATAAGSSVAASPTGVSGTFGGVYGFSDGNILSAMLTVPTSVASPISNASLLYIREVSGAGSLEIASVSLMGVYV